jgi:transcriptional regulator GlxA family with amidase domain
MQTVEEVALASGFTSANSFSRAFRQKFGHSPRSGAHHPAEK